jgi:hypothetical protein
MNGIDTARMTYEEALVEMNRKTESDYLNKYANKFINGHFREMNRES